MKRKILLIALAVSCLAILAAGSIAYFTATGEAHNVITTGNIHIELLEFTEEDGAFVEFPANGLSVMPGTEASKIVQVKNTGDNPAFVRVKVKKVIHLATPNIPAVFAAGDFPDSDLLSPNINTAYWDETDPADGYYYYNAVLAPGETTEPLFETVTFAATMGNDYQNSTATITVSAQAVQSQNNPGATALTAQGWPTNP